jgi:hypothetical protein
MIERCFIKSWSTSGDAADEPDEFVFGTELPAVQSDSYVITSVEHSATSDISPWTVTHGGRYCFEALSPWTVTHDEATLLL